MSATRRTAGLDPGGHPGPTRARGPARSLKYDLTDGGRSLEPLDAPGDRRPGAAGAIGQRPSFAAARHRGVGSFVESVGGVSVPCTWEAAKVDLGPASTRVCRGGESSACPRTRRRTSRAVSGSGRPEEAGRTRWAEPSFCFATGLPVGLAATRPGRNRLDGRLRPGLPVDPGDQGGRDRIGFRSAELPRLPGPRRDFPARAEDGRRGLRPGARRPGGRARGRHHERRGPLGAGCDEADPDPDEPLRTVDLVHRRAGRRVPERSDVCAVPAASVVGEAASALNFAAALLEKFGGDRPGGDSAEPRAVLENVGQRWTKFVILTGFMGVGKSATGRALAGLLGWEFVDLDEAIRRPRGSPSQDLRGRGGGALPRPGDRGSGRNLNRSRSCSRPVAGGSSCASANRELLRGRFVVNLEASAEECVRRVGGARPSGLSSRTRPRRGGPRAPRQPRAALRCRAAARLDRGKDPGGGGQGDRGAVLGRSAP